MSRTPLTAETADLSGYVAAVAALDLPVVDVRRETGSGEHVPSVVCWRFANGYGLSIVRGGMAIARGKTVDTAVIRYDNGTTGAGAAGPIVGVDSCVTTSGVVDLAARVAAWQPTS